MADAGLLSPQRGITGVILAGGQGTRMGGADKGLALLDGKPLAAWVAERLQPQVDTLLINANRNVYRYAALGYTVFSDRIPGFAGPLAGLQAALAYTDTPLVATAPCDSPYFPADVVARLVEAMTAAGKPMAIASTPQRLHPVFCVCHARLLPVLQHFLDSGGRRFLDLFDRAEGVAVSFPDAGKAFANVNTRDELEQLQP